MRIFAYNTLREHWEQPGRGDSEKPLRDWFNIVKASDWPDTAAVKAQFRSVSFVGERMVFNIAGNKYRLVAYVNHQWRTVYVRFIGTHAEYDDLNRSGKLESI